MSMVSPAWLKAKAPCWLLVLPCRTATAGLAWRLGPVPHARLEAAEAGRLLKMLAGARWGAAEVRRGITALFTHVV